MSGKRSQTMLSSSSTHYNPFNGNDRDPYNKSQNNYLNVSTTQNNFKPRSSSSLGVDAELTNIAKEGKDYHVSVNLNSLLSANNQLGTQSSSTKLLRRNDFSNNNNRQTHLQQSSNKTLESRQNFSHNGNINNNLSPVLNYAGQVGGAKRTVVTLEGQDDHNLFAAYQQNQQNQERKRHTLATVPSQGRNSYHSITTSSISPQFLSPASETSAFTVRSVSSSDVKRQETNLRNNEVEFNLHLKGQILKEVPQKKWEITGTLPAREKAVKKSETYKSRSQRTRVEVDDEEEEPEFENPVSRSGRRPIVNDDDEDYTDQGPIKHNKDTVAELENLVMGHSLIKNTPGRSQHKLEIEREKDKIIGPLTTQQTEGLINVDIVTEKVELVLENEEADVVIQVRCERIIPLEDSNELFKKSGVLAIKTMEFDMMSTQARRELYEKAVERQNNASNGKLEQSEIFELYTSLMNLVESETKSNVSTMGGGASFASKGANIYGTNKNFSSRSVKLPASDNNYSGGDRFSSGNNYSGGDTFSSGNNYSGGDRFSSGNNNYNYNNNRNSGVSFSGGNGGYRSTSGYTYGNGFGTNGFANGSRDFGGLSSTVAENNKLRSTGLNHHGRTRSTDNWLEDEDDRYYSQLLQEPRQRLFTSREGF